MSKALVHYYVSTRQELLRQAMAYADARTRERGYILYPGKLTQVETFRVGCIGAIDANEMRNVVSAVAQTLKDMGIARVAPQEPRRAA